MSRVSARFLLPRADSAHKALRTATAPNHEAVDALFGGYDLGSEDGYRRFLLAQASAFLPVEAALDAAGAAGVMADWPARLRGDRLRADLTDLGAETPPPESSPAFDGDAAILGGIYVLEGSRLGGGLLKRSVPAALPRRFLEAPQEPGAWRAVLLALDDILVDPKRMAVATTAAQGVFSVFAAGARRFGGVV